jgi:hypothetical protein
MYWGIPVYGEAFPNTGVPQYMRMLFNLLGYPNICESMMSTGGPRCRELIFIL